MLASFLQTPASQAPVSQSAVGLPCNDFQPLAKGHNLPYPFNNKYEFTLACPQCFVRHDVGPEGRHLEPNLPHHCDLDEFLVRTKGSNEMWNRVRQRPWVSQTETMGEAGNLEMRLELVLTLCQTYSIV